MIRAFLALPVPPALWPALVALRDALGPGRAVPDENFHVTLAFLGEQREDVLEDLHHLLEARRAPALALHLRGVGVFGAEAPRLVWAGVVPDPALERLAKGVAQDGRRAGITLEKRRFLPHASLKWLSKRPEDAAPVQRFLSKHQSFECEPVAVDHYALYASHLRSGGPVYEELARYPLR